MWYRREQRVKDDNKLSTVNTEAMMAQPNKRKKNNHSCNWNEQKNSGLDICVSSACKISSWRYPVVRYEESDYKIQSGLNHRSQMLFCLFFYHAW